MNLNLWPLGFCLIAFSGCHDCSTTSGSADAPAAPLPVPPPAWGAAEQVAGTIVSPGAYSPDVATDSKGNAIVVWFEGVDVFNGFASIPMSREVWANRFTVGVGWSGPVKIIDGTWVLEPKVAMDEEGNALVLASGQFGNGWELVAVRYDPQSGWQEQDVLSVQGAFRPAMTSGGDAIIAWLENTGQYPMGISEVWAGRYVAGAGLQGAQRIGPADGYALTASIAATPDGTAMVVWPEYDGTRTDLWAARFDGTAWDSPESIEPAGGFNAGNPLTSDLPPVVLDGDGNAFAARVQEDEAFAAQNTRSSIWVNRFVPGTGWGNPIKLDTVVSTVARNPTLAVNADGTALVAWDEPDGPSALYPTRIWTSRFTPQAGWIGPVSLELGWSPRAGMDPDGRAVVLYMDFSQVMVDWSVWAIHHKPATGWGEAVQIDGALVDGFSQVVAVSPKGMITVAWQQPLVGGFSVCANRFD